MGEQGVIRAYVNSKGDQDRHQARSQAKRKEPGSPEGRWKQKERTRNVRRAARSPERHTGGGPGRCARGQGKLPVVGSENPGNLGSSQERGWTVSKEADPQQVHPAG